MGILWKVLTRRKVIDADSLERTQLSRVLNTFDLTALGVGSTLGVGVYVVVGQVARATAGPSVVLSFLIAAIASVFAGLCYAEFGARAPKAGSAYIYSYVCVGEFIAFVIGWNLILEYVIGSASVAKGVSAYIDSLTNHTLENAFLDIAPIDVPYLGKYFDFFAFALSMALAIALAFGMKESSMVNNIFTCLNIALVIFVIIAGAIKADPANWNVQPNSTNSSNIGKGGFFPFGVEGMIKGAATCFYAFVGFDCIATCGEEVKNPKKAIPFSIVLSLFVIFLAYCGTSTVVTLMVPYYAQDIKAPIPHAFETVGWDVAKWIVAVGGIFGLMASLFGAMFPLPRIIYAMANDSLIFRFLGKVSPRFNTPVIGTLFAGLLTGLISAIFDLDQLVKMMSIGTLLAYTIVAASVLLLRYAKEETHRYTPIPTHSDSDDSEQYAADDKLSINGEGEQINYDSQELIINETVEIKKILKQIFNCGRIKNPTNISQVIANINVFLYCVACVFIGLCVLYMKDNILDGEVWAIVLTSIAVSLAVIIIMSLVTQPVSQKELSFKVPFVPFIPAISIFINIYLMLMLDVHTWIRFAIWMVIGIPTYYFSIRSPAAACNNHLVFKNNVLETGENTESTKESHKKDSFNELQESAVLAELDQILDRADSINENITASSFEQSDVSCELSNASLSVNVESVRSEPQPNTQNDNNLDDSQKESGTIKSKAPLPPVDPQSSVLEQSSIEVTGKQKSRAPPPPPMPETVKKENNSNKIEESKITNETNKESFSGNVDNNENNEEEKVENNEVIPKPPPMSDFLEFNSNETNRKQTISDLKSSQVTPSAVNLLITKREIDTVKLKHVDLEEIEKELNKAEEINELPNGHIDMNSKVGLEFKAKLEKVIKPYIRPIVGHLPPDIIIKNENVTVNKENIEDAHIDISQSKQFLEGNLRFSLEPASEPEQNDNEPKTYPNTIGHSSFKDTERPKLDDIYNNHLESDQKADSLMENNKQKLHNLGKSKTVGHNMSKNDVESHRLKMNDVFSNIKALRKNSKDAL